MLVAELFHGVDLDFDARQIILQLIDLELIQQKASVGVGVGIGVFTPRAFLSMILMATFSPVSVCVASFTLANPPLTTFQTVLVPKLA